jgi:cell division protein FtsL
MDPILIKNDLPSAQKSEKELAKERKKALKVARSEKRLKRVVNFNLSLLLLFAIFAIFLQEIKVMRLKNENAELVKKVSAQQEELRDLRIKNKKD